MKVGDLVLVVNEFRAHQDRSNDSVHMIIGHGTGDWDWELWFAGSKHQKQFTWYALEEELVVVE